MSTVQGAAPVTATALAVHRASPLVLLLIGGWAFLLPVQMATPLGPRFAPADLLLIVYALVRLPALRHAPAAWSPWTHALVAVLGLGLVVALLRTGTLSQYALVQKGVGLALLLLTYACVVDAVTSWERARWLVGAFVRGVLLHAAIALAAFGLTAGAGIEVPSVNQPYPAARIAGLLIDPNAFGGLVALALVLHVLTARSAHPLLRGWQARAADVVLPLALLLTFSRSAWIGFALAMSAAALLAARPTGAALVRTAVPVLVAAPLVLVLVPDVESLVRRPDQVDARLALAQGAVEDFLTSPVVGIGLGVNAASSENIIHNTALWFMAEFGVVGLVVFTGFALAHVYRAVVVARRAAAPDRPLAVALMAGHVAMLGLSTGIEALYQRHWWLVLAVIGALVGRTLRRDPW